MRVARAGGGATAAGKVAYSQVSVACPGPGHASRVCLSEERKHTLTCTAVTLVLRLWHWAATRVRSFWLASASWSRPSTTPWRLQIGRCVGKGSYIYACFVSLTHPLPTTFLSLTPSGRLRLPSSSPRSTLEARSPGSTSSTQWLLRTRAHLPLLRLSSCALKSRKRPSKCTCTLETGSERCVERLVVAFVLFVYQLPSRIICDIADARGREL